MARLSDSPFGIRLREAFKGASNAEIQQKLGASSKSTVSNYMKGRIPDGETLIRIAQLANCNLHWLLTGEGESDLDPLGFIDEEQRHLVQRLAADRGIALTEVLNDLITTALVKLGSELFAQHRTLHATEFEQLHALFHALYSRETNQGTKTSVNSKLRPKSGAKSVVRGSELMESVTAGCTSVAEACEAAKILQEQGKYEEAANYLISWWGGPGTDPEISGLEEIVSAELLLLAGTLSGQIGSSAQTRDFQERAKDLLSQASESFEKLSLWNKVAESRSALAVCYWRSGSFEEARTILRDVLNIENLSNDALLRVMITLALVESQAGSLHEALAIYSGASKLCTGDTSHYLTGTYHMNFALALSNAGEIDRALIESQAASFHFEQCGHLRYQARVFNNNALLLLAANRLDEAQLTAARSERILRNVQDVGTLAQVLETRAQIYLAQGKPSEALRLATNAVEILNCGDERKALVEAIVTKGVALLRLHEFASALEEFKVAFEIAQIYLSEERAAKTLTKLIEELSGQIDLPTELRLEKEVNTTLS